MLTWANMSLAIEPSGPGLPSLRFWEARTLVSRRASARIHSFISSSRAAGERSTASPDCQMRTASAMAPEPRAGVPPPPPMVVRSLESVVMATRQPSPTSPMRSASGTRTSVM
jgi:hypothetical protein